MAETITSTKGRRLFRPQFRRVRFMIKWPHWFGFKEGVFVGVNSHIFRQERKQTGGRGVGQRRERTNTELYTNFL